MSGFVLDTCVLIDFDSVDLGEHGQGDPTFTAVTVGELAFGVDVGSAEERAARAARLSWTLANYEVLPYGVEAAKLYGVLAMLTRSRNPRPRRLDLQIAATAAAARFPLLTTNPDDFRGLERLVTVIPLNRVS